MTRRYVVIVKLTPMAVVVTQRGGTVVAIVARMHNTMRTGLRVLLLALLLRLVVVVVVVVVSTFFLRHTSGGATFGV